jgi:hypothetical protein
MTREDIIKAMGESGVGTMLLGVQHDKAVERLTRFAALVAAAEREACARVCDVLAAHPEYASDITKLAAHAIRARSQA